MKKIMIIGGTDSSGGAGLTRDATVAHALGFDVLPVVTAVTAQSTAALIDLQLLSVEFVSAQIHAALATECPVAVKIGMMGSNEIAIAVAMALSELSVPVVIDPVIKSSSGGSLMNGGMPQQLLSLADLVTPNLPEAAVLSDRSCAVSDAEIATQADWFLAQGAKAVLIKGGHAGGETVCDHLFGKSTKHVLKAPRLKANMRGTGCTLATAIACHLADGRGVFDACGLAKNLVHSRIREAAGHQERARGHTEGTVRME